MQTAAEQYANHITAARQLLPLGYIEYMPTKEVTGQELQELKTHADFNPTHCYGLESDYYPDMLHPNERGHDQCYRYVTTPSVTDNLNQ